MEMTDTGDRRSYEAYLDMPSENTSGYERGPLYAQHKEEEKI